MRNRPHQPRPIRPIKAHVDKCWQYETMSYEYLACLLCNTPRCWSCASLSPNRHFRLQTVAHWSLDLWRYHNDDTHYPILYKKVTLQLPRKPNFARLASIMPRYRDFQCRARNRAEGLSKLVGTKDFGRLSLSVSLHLLLNPVELLGILEVTNLNDGCSCDASKVMTYDLLLDSLTTIIMGIFFITLLVPVHPAIVSVPSFQWKMMMYCDA